MPLLEHHGLAGEDEDKMQNHEEMSRGDRGRERGVPDGTELRVPGTLKSSSSCAHSSKWHALLTSASCLTSPSLSGL